MAASLRKTTLGTLGAGLASFALNLGIGIITARVLGPNDRGLFALAAVLPHTVVTFVKLGLAQATIYSIKRERVNASLVASHLLLIALGGSVLAVSGMWLFKWQAMHVLLKGAPMLCFVFSVLLVPFLMIESYFFGVLQAIGKFAIFNRRRLLGSALSLAAMFTALVVFDGRLIAALAVTTGVTIVLDTWLVGTIHRLCRLRWVWDGRLTKRLLSFGIKSHLQSIATHLNFRADMYLIAVLLNPSEVAFYSIATRLAELLLFVPESLGLVVYPRQAGSALPQLQELTARSCRHVLFTTATAGFLLMLVGPRLIVMWYGQNYAPGGPPLYYLTPAAVMMSLFFMLSRNFTSQNRQGVNMIASGLALGCNVLLNLFLIPRMGISGAGLSSLVSYSIATAILAYVYLNESQLSLRDVFVIRISDLSVYRRLAHDAFRRQPPTKAAIEPSAAKG